MEIQKQNLKEAVALTEQISKENLPINKLGDVLMSIHVIDKYINRLNELKTNANKQLSKFTMADIESAYGKKPCFNLNDEVEIRPVSKEKRVLTYDKTLFSDKIKTKALRENREVLSPDLIEKAFVDKTLDASLAASVNLTYLDTVVYSEHKVSKK